MLNVCLLNQTLIAPPLYSWSLDIGPVEIGLEIALFFKSVHTYTHTNALLS